MLSLSNFKNPKKSANKDARVTDNVEERGRVQIGFLLFFLRCSEEMMLFAVCITDTAALPHLLLYQNTVLFYIFCYLGFQKASATVSVVTQQFSKKLLFFPPSAD